jgi:hypothetical protein
VLSRILEDLHPAFFGLILEYLLVGTRANSEYRERRITTIAADVIGEGQHLSISIKGKRHNTGNASRDFGVKQTCGLAGMYHIQVHLKGIVPLIVEQTYFAIWGHLCIDDGTKDSPLGYKLAQGGRDLQGWQRVAPPSESPHV